MITLLARMVLAANRVFPRPMEYDTGPEADYSQWEHDTGRDMYLCHFQQRVPVAGQRVLDIGCGTGGKSVYYASLAPEVLCALDIEVDNVARAAAFAARHEGCQARFLAADASYLPLPDQSVDVITTTDTFEHFPDPRRVLGEMARVLRPGGAVLFYFTPHRSPLGSHLYDVIHLPWCHMLVPHTVLFRAIELKYARAARAAGAEHPDELAREKTREAREYYRRHLNRMTVGRFLKLVKDNGSFELEGFKRKPLRTKLMAPLTRIPHLGEFVTTLAIGVLRKR